MKKPTQWATGRLTAHRSTRRILLCLGLTALALGAAEERGWSYALWPVLQPNTGEIQYVHWEQVKDGSPVRYLISPEGSSQDPEGRAFDIIIESHSRWSEPDTAAITYEGVIADSTLVVDSLDGINVTVFRPPGFGLLGPGVVGYAIETFDLTTGNITDSDMVFNDGFPYSFEPESVQETDLDQGIFSLYDLVTHEAGHRIGMGHTYIRDAAMYPFIGPFQGELTADDIGGLSFLYPEPSFFTEFGTVSGRVVAEENKAGILGSHIVAVDTETKRPVISTYTNVDGSFSMRGVPPEDYFFRFETSDPTRVWDYYAPGLIQQVYQAEYFGNTQRADIAEVVVVQAGQEVPNVDFLVNDSFSKDSFEDDNHPSMANPVSVDGLQQIHTFYPPGDRDYFSFEAAAGNTYVIKVADIENHFTTEFFADTGQGVHTLILYDRDGRTILETNDAFDPWLTNQRDNPWGNTKNQIVFTPTESGTYFASVQNIPVTVLFALNFFTTTYKYHWGPGTAYSFNVQEIGGPLPTPTPPINPTPIPTPSPVPHALPPSHLVSPNEGPIPVMGIDLPGRVTEDHPRLKSVTVLVESMGVSFIGPDNFLPITSLEDSGLSVWADGGTSQGSNLSEGGFDEETDSFLQPEIPPRIVDRGVDGFEVTFTFRDDDVNTFLNTVENDGIFDFFVVARLSSQIEHGQQFRLTIPANEILIQSNRGTREEFAASYPPVPKTLTGDIVRLVNFVERPVINDDDQAFDREEQVISGSSEPVPVLGINAAGPKSGSYKLHKVRVTIVPVKNFTRGDLLPLGEGLVSGLTLWQDAPGSESGVFEPEADLVLPVNLPSYQMERENLVVEMVVSDPPIIPEDDISADNEGADFFLTVRTSDRIRYGDMFRIELREDPVTGEGPVVLQAGSSSVVSTQRTITDETVPPTYSLKAKPTPVFTFMNMVEPGQTVPHFSRGTAVLGIDVVDYGAENWFVGDQEDDGYVFEDFRLQVLDVNGDGDFTIDDLRPIISFANIDPVYFETDQGIAIYADDDTILGNQVDDDGDGYTDEESFNNMDDDQDGLTDEDLGDFDGAGFANGLLDSRDDLLAEFPGSHWPVGNLNVGQYTPPVVTALSGGRGYTVDFDMRYTRLGELHDCLGGTGCAHPFGPCSGPGIVADGLWHGMFNGYGGSLNLLRTNNFPIFFGGSGDITVEIQGGALLDDGCGYNVDGGILTADNASINVSYDHYIELPNDNIGPMAGADFFVAIRTNDTAGHGDDFQIRIDPGAMTYSRYVDVTNIELAPGSSDGFLLTNPLSVYRPINLRLQKLTQPGQEIGPTSTTDEDADEPLAAIGIDLDVGGSPLRALPGNSEEFVYEFAVELVNVDGFTPSDLLPITTGEFSGIALYQDNGEFEGLFEVDSDTHIPLASPVPLSQITGSGTDADPYVVRITPQSPLPVPYDDNGSTAGPDYYIVLRASSSIDFQDAFRVRIRPATFEGSAPVESGLHARNTDVIRARVPLLISDITDLTEQGQTIPGANFSPRVPVFGINVRDNGRDVVIERITVEFQGLAQAGEIEDVTDQDQASVFFTRTDLAAPATDPSSGLALYRDNGDGTFNVADTFVAMARPVWNNLRLTMSFLSGVEVPDADPNNDIDFFVVVRPSATIADRETFRACIPTGGISFGTDGSSTQAACTNFLTARVSPQMEILQPAQDQQRTSRDVVTVEWRTRGESAPVQLYVVDLAEAVAERGLDEDALRGTPLAATDTLLTPITQRLPAGSRGEVNWDLSQFGSGSYIVYGIVDPADDFGQFSQDGIADFGWDYSPGIVNINNPAPVLAILEPDTAGEEPLGTSIFYSIVYDATFTSTAALDLFAQPVDLADGQGRITIATGAPLTDGPLRGSYNWNISAVPNGEYRIVGILRDGRRSVQAESPGTVLVDRDATVQGGGWPLAFTGNILGSPLLVDLDGVVQSNRTDLEVVLAVNDGRLHALKSNTASVPGFPVQTGAVLNTAPAGADIDDDGSVEIVVTGINGEVFVVNANGTVDAGFDNSNRAKPVRDLDGEIAAGPALVDVDLNSAGHEIILVAGKVPTATATVARVHVLSATGRLLASETFPVAMRVSLAPAIGDFDGDGNARDIAVATSEGVYVFLYDEGSLNLVDASTVNNPLPVTTSPVFADLDGNGRDELLFGDSTGALYALEADGSLYPGFPVALNSSMNGAPAVGRLQDADSQPSIVIGTLDSRVHIVSATGDASYLLSDSVKLDGFLRTSPAIADVVDSTGNAGQEILVTTTNGLLYLMNAGLEDLDGGVPTPVFQLQGEIRTAPAVGSLDYDRDLEVVVAALNPDRLHVIDLPEVVDGQAEWPQSRRGPARTGRWQTLSILTSPLYVLDGEGNIVDIDGNVLTDAPYFGWDISRQLVRANNGEGLYILDGFGGIHPVGSAPDLTGAPYFGWDIARDMEAVPAQGGYLILDGFGATYGVDMDLPGQAPYFGWNIAKALAVTPSGDGYYVLDGYGGVHPVGDAKPFDQQAIYFGWDIARDIVLTKDGNGLLLLDGLGQLHALGDAPDFDGGVFFGSDVAVGVQLSADGQTVLILAREGELVYSRKSDGSVAPALSIKETDKLRKDALRAPRDLMVIEE